MTMIFVLNESHTIQTMINYENNKIKLQLLLSGANLHLFIANCI